MVRGIGFPGGLRCWDGGCEGAEDVENVCVDSCCAGLGEVGEDIHKKNASDAGASILG